MIVVLLGPPGCGKGTQGERLAAALGVPKISTGDVIRAAMKAGTPLGLQAKAFYDKGDLVPDALILDIMREALASPAQVKGAILDGVVRTVPQAEGLAQVLGGLGKRLDLVLMFQIADEELVGRLSARTVCGAGQSPFRGRQPGELHAEGKLLVVTIPPVYDDQRTGVDFQIARYFPRGSFRFGVADSSESHALPQQDKDDITHPDLALREILTPRPTCRGIAVCGRGVTQD